MQMNLSASQKQKRRKPNSRPKSLVIAYVVDQYWPTISGSPVSVDAFKNEMVRMGHTVYILAPDHPGASELDSVMRNTNIIRFASFRIIVSKADRLAYPSERKNVFRVLDDINPDIIHIHNEFTLAKIAIDYARIKNMPLIMTAHTNWEELVHHYIPIAPSWFLKMFSRRYMSFFLGKADAVVVPTTLMMKLLKSYHIKKPMHIIPTGLANHDFGKHEFNLSLSRRYFVKKFPLLKNKRILLAAGRIGKEKNLVFVLSVYKKLLDEFNDIILVIVGDGPYREELEQEVRKHGLDGKVVFTGFIEKKHMRDIYSISNILLFASKVETQGLVTIEAMSCGTPVVAIGEMGTREVMNGDNGGFMVRDDQKEFLARVRQLLSDNKLYQRKSKEAIKYASQWTIGRFSEKMQALYYAVIQKVKK